ncbi:hypothetical protein JL721_912 [Aureococcus anophagefferens]|nr:hypothetical protein JL721_912 [Aureococcus anophagefferens]
MSITCTSCGDVLEPAGFSKNQLRTPKTARCRCGAGRARGGGEALAAIFGDEFRPLPPGGAAARYEIALAADRAAVALDVVCGAGYPVDGAPTFAVRAVAACDEGAARADLRRGGRGGRGAGGRGLRLRGRGGRARRRRRARRGARRPAAEARRRRLDLRAGVPQFGQRPVRFDAASGDDAHAVEIFDGEPVTDRRSTFQAFLAVGVDSLDKAQWAFRAILARNKCGRATHNMRAYRFTDAAGVRRADNDSDGEDGAGEKMAYLLDVLDADGVAVVVSRWYGGVHLGPDRFRHIAHCTQKILEAHGHARRARKKRS